MVCNIKHNASYIYLSLNSAHPICDLLAILCQFQLGVYAYFERIVYTL